MVQYRFAAPLITLWVIACCWSWSPTALARGQPARVDDEWRTLPSSFEHGLVFVTVGLEDRDDLWFVLDTGSPRSSIDERLAADLRLNVEETPAKEASSPPHRFVREVDLRISGETFKTGVYIKPVDELLSKRFGRRLSGIIGYDYFYNRVVRIDYEREQVQVRDGSAFAYEGGGTVLPIITDGSYFVALATISVSGQPKGVPLIIDTGASSCVDLTREWAAWLRVPELHRGLVASKAVTLYGEERSFHFLLERLQVGPFTIDNAEASRSSLIFRGNAGALGAGFLERFTVILDMQQGRVALEPNSRWQKPIRRSSSGLGVAAEDGNFRTYRIDHVEPESPAEEAGFEIGDRLESINGASTADLRLSDLADIMQDHLDRPVRFKVLRDNQTVELIMTPVDLPTRLRNSRSK